MGEKLKYLPLQKHIELKKKISKPTSGKKENIGKGSRRRES